jgi:hypothetical protein
LHLSLLFSALLEEAACLSPATAMGVLEAKIKKVDLLEICRQALAAGRNFIDSQVRGAQSASPTASRTKHWQRFSSPDIPTGHPAHPTVVAHNRLSYTCVSVS